MDEAIIVVSYLRAEIHEVENTFIIVNFNKYKYWFFKNNYYLYIKLSETD